MPFEKLLTYNREDCEALRRVTEFLLADCCKDEAGPAEGHPAVAPAESIRQPGTFRFGRPKFFCPELEQITKCAYSDYQRERVYVRTSPAVRKSLRRKLRVVRRRLKVNEHVQCRAPERCPECGSTQVQDLHRAPTRCSST